jgi:uncharacterized repeat protein (TIGR03803 family)
MRWASVLLRAALALMVAVTVATNVRAHTYKFHILHSFCISHAYCPDGKTPLAGVVMDSAGNLYGTASNGGGPNHAGTVFELQRDSAKQRWRFKVLYRFCVKDPPWCNDGTAPSSSLIIDASGNLYGTTLIDGRRGGTVFRLSPNPPHSLWKLQSLYKFCSKARCWHGQAPLYGGLDYQGKETGAPYDGVSPLYGTTFIGGVLGGGVVFMLTPNSDKTHLSNTVLHDFCTETPCTNGFGPSGGLIMDAAGNLYGTTTDGVANPSTPGTVFELSPGPHHKWTYTILHRFCSQPNCADGMNPTSTLLMDSSGALIGTTGEGGRSGFGVAFKLAPQNSVWTETVLYDFCTQGFDCSDGGFPYAGLVMDPSGKLFGVSWMGGSALFGTVFKLGRHLETLHNFCIESGCPDGEYTSYGSLAMDAEGNLFGTAYEGGTFGGGTVFELTP